MMKALLIPFMLLLFSNSPEKSVILLNQGTQESQTGTLEKMIVANGHVAMDIDLARLNRLSPSSQMSTLHFAVAPNSFFTILVFNNELRGPELGSMQLVPESFAALPPALSSSLNQLVVEKIGWTEPFDIVVRDANTGFTFFNIEGNLYDYDAQTRSFSINEGRLLISEEFAAKLGRPSEAGSVVGAISITAAMKAIEVTQMVNGEPVSAVLPPQDLPETHGNPGPDVIVGEITALQQFGSSGTQVGLAVGTDSCNAGQVPLNWFSLPANDHPVIPQNVYRMSGGVTNNERFEQIGQSWLKHAFTALQGNVCGFGCEPNPDGTRLGSGCSDPYSASLNASQNGLGSRAWVNPFTGFYPGSNPNPANHSGHTHLGTSHRVIVEMNDLNPPLNAGATYYAEATYVTPHEYAWCQSHPGQCNMYNNVSYRRYNVAGGPTNFTFTSVGSTVRTRPAIMAWTGATFNQIQPDPGIDGIGFVGYKVTNSGNVWHYDYAVYNENLDRAIQSFTVPLGPGITVSNIGFHAPPQQPGFANDGTNGSQGYSSTPWAVTQTANSLMWNTETILQNQNANAIRWGTLYNFRFDSDRPPQTTEATIGFYKTGAPITVQILGPSQGCPIGNDYGVTSSMGAVMVTGTAQVPGSVCNNCTVTIPLPFTYSFYGTNYSSVVAGNDGTLQFTGNSTDNSNVCLPAASHTDTIFPYWDNLNTNISDVMGIWTSVSGTAPNRIFNIEWRAGYEAADAVANFEVRLYEDQPKFDVIYGNVTTHGFSATVGVQQGDGAVHKTQYECNTANSIQNGQKLTFDLRACGAQQKAESKFDILNLLVDAGRPVSWRFLR